MTLINYKFHENSLERSKANKVDVIKIDNWILDSKNKEKVNKDLDLQPFR